MSQKSEQAIRIAFSKMAVRMGEKMVAGNIPLSIIEARYNAVRSRIKAGTFSTCEHCNGLMPLITTDEKRLLSTTCSGTCEEILLAKDDSRRLPLASTIFKDFLLEHLQIKARLGIRQYKGREVTIVAADLDEVETHGVNAMVTISHLYNDMPSEVRIAAFVDSAQSAIIRSLIDEIPIAEARMAIVKDGMEKAANMHSFSSNRSFTLAKGRTIRSCS